MPQTFGMHCPMPLLDTVHQTSPVLHARVVEISVLTQQVQHGHNAHNPSRSLLPLTLVERSDSDVEQNILSSPVSCCQNATQRWGAHLDHLQTWGPQSPLEVHSHINLLELKAIWLAYFKMDPQSNCWQKILQLCII